MKRKEPNDYNKGRNIFIKRAVSGDVDLFSQVRELRIGRVFVFPQFCKKKKHVRQGALNR
jgi:hypothetical protein